MKSISKWVFAATLVIGASVFTSCSNDISDNGIDIEQAKKNRQEFVAHTQATMKDLAENLNFTSWEAANSLNLYFNQYVLNNPEFNRAVLESFLQKSLMTLQPVEEGSELAQMGFQQYATVDLLDYNFRFTMNDDNSGFDIEESDNFEVILNSFNTLTQQMESGIFKLTLKSGGDTSFKFVVPVSQLPGLAFVVLFPSEFQFAISNKIDGT